MENTGNISENNIAVLFEYLTEDQKENIRKSKNTGDVFRILGIYRIS